MTFAQTWTRRARDYSGQAGIFADLLLADASWYLQGGRRRAALEHDRTISEHKWCFIVGCNNSGTSLLQGILEKSGQVSTFPHEGQRYTRALKIARKRGHERVWTEYLGELRLDSENSGQPARRLVHDWMRKLASPVRETIVEKTTANAVRMLWLQSVFPRSYFIGLVRNGFAVSEGIRRKGDKSIERAARHWNLVNDIMLRDAEHVDRFLLVRYEDLVSDATGAVRALADFLSLDHEQISKATTLSYELKTARGTGRQSITNMNRDSFARLSPADLETVRLHAGPMLEHLGYTAEVPLG